MSEFTLKRPMLRYFCKKDEKWKDLLNGCHKCEYYRGITLVGHGKHKYVKCGYAP